VEKYQIKRLVLGANETNCYIVVYDSAGEKTPRCALIDPGDEAAVIIAQLGKMSLRPSHILLTHGHFDHIAALGEVHTAYPEAPIAIHRGDAPYLGPNCLRLHGRTLGVAKEDDAFIELQLGSVPSPNLELVDGDRVGPFKVLSVPGHTPGSAAFLLEEQNIMFSGDTLFKGTCGRVDLPGGNRRAIEESLQRLLAMDGAIQVLPGHGDSTTIAAERKTRFF
jgi:glyoxylase-like metal-dependent hydrolase (beta-lactamase superfamily II)